MKKLNGKVIKEINVFGEYHDKIQFVTDSGDICFYTYGDCCSSSFFSDIWNAQNIIGEKVITVEDIDLQPGEAPNRGAEDDDNEQIYGIKITSEKGSCVIIFRNHSNGYYGGSIEDGSSPKEDEKKWAITQNWSAPSL